MTRRTTLSGLVLTALLAAVPSARAACTAPAPPDPASKPEKPVLPVKGPCVDAKMGAPGCLGWEPYKYNDDVKAFNEKAAVFQKAAQAYVDKLNAYVSAGADYARCEIKALQ